MAESFAATGSAADLAQRCGMAAGVSLDPRGIPQMDTNDGESLTSTFAAVALVFGEADQGAGMLFTTNR